MSNKTYDNLGPPIPEQLPDSAPFHIEAWSASINTLSQVTATFRGHCHCCGNKLTLFVEVNPADQILLSHLNPGNNSRTFIPETYNFPGQLIDLARTKAKELRKTRNFYAKH